jgi:holin-like protein
MAKGFSLLLVCLLAGEGAAQVYRLPVPGSICGMALLFGLLFWRGEPVSILSISRIQADPSI